MNTRTLASLADQDGRGVTAFRPVQKLEYALKVLPILGILAQGRFLANKNYTAYECVRGNGPGKNRSERSGLPQD